MLTIQVFSAVIISLLLRAAAIWPPAYKINLTHEETFVISEELGSDDIYQAEDEMIQDEQLKSFNLDDDSGKYWKLHRLAVRHNGENKVSHYNKKPLPKAIESNFELDESEPIEGSFVRKDAEVVHQDGVISVDKKEWVREVPAETNVTEQIYENYDYASLKREHDMQIKKVQKSNETVNYTEVKEEESFNDAVKAIAGESKPRNCTVEERKGIGIAAAECLLLDLTKPNVTQKEKSQIFHRIGTIILIWLSVYLLVAIPCWCQRGWCCCCFQCKFCKPKERIDGAKKYLLDNPPGVYHTPNNKKCTYKPTNYEQYAQQKLEKALLKI